MTSNKARNRKASGKSTLASPLLSYWRERAEKPLAIDVSDNPFDLRPAAYAVTNRIEALKDLYPGDPLIIPTGELHTESHTQLMQQAVMQECINRGLKPAYGLENNYRTLPFYAEKLGHQFDSRDFERLKNEDPHNHLLRKMAVVFARNVSEFQKMRLCDDLNLSISFNDAADKYFSEDKLMVLDYEDDFTKNVAKKLGYNTSIDELNVQIESGSSLNDDDDLIIDYGGHGITSKTGFHIRNEIIAAHTIDQYHTQNPDLLVVEAGVVHVLGAFSKVLGTISPYEHSLTKLFREHSQAVLPCAFSWKSLKLPKDADYRSSIILQGLERVSDDISDHIDAVANESGGLIGYYPPLSGDLEKSFFVDLYKLTKLHGLKKASI